MTTPRNRSNWRNWALLGLGGFALPAAVIAMPAAAYAEGATTLERPSFDRGANVVLIPFSGPLPRIETDSSDNGTRLIATFDGAQAHPAVPYKLGVFHPLVSRVEMTPSADTSRVKVSIWLTQPGSLNVVPDTRRGVLRLQVGAARLEPPVDLSTPVGPQPLGLGAASQAVLPRARQDAPAIVAMTSRATSAANAPAPQPMPSLPPVGVSSHPNNILPGTPNSGEYVYRKAIPAANGNDVTEVMVRTGTRSAVGVDRNYETDAVQVDVRPPGGVPVQRPEGWEKPNESWRQPVYRAEAAFKPVAAVDTLVGFTLMNESAPKLGSNFSGSGSTLYGGAIHLPVGNAWNVRLQAESYAYTISSLQVPDATMRRDEYFGDFAVEYLPIRRPWVLATGLGYWARYMSTKTNLLAPPDPSILFQPTMLWHGPTLNARVYYPMPFWDALALTVDAEGAPYMFGLTDAVSTSMGNMFGYEGTLGLKYSTRHFSAILGYRYQGYQTFNSVFSANRSGPELSAVWRF